MKKILNGKMYNTDTAKLCSDYSNDRSDFGHVYEKLYRKKTGEFFLYGIGGPMTRYAVQCGNTTTGSEQIIPYTEKQAKEWMEKYASVEEYESVFGKVSEMNLFYWSCFPMHGLVWANSEDDAANKVTEHLQHQYTNEVEGCFDDVAIYPVYQDVHNEFQMLDA